MRAWQSPGLHRLVRPDRKVWLGPRRRPRQRRVPLARRTQQRPLGRLTAHELVVQLVHALVQSEERGAELLGLIVAETSRGHAAHGLPLEQLAEDLDEDEDELCEAPLQRILVRLET